MKMYEGDKLLRVLCVRLRQKLVVQLSGLLEEVEPMLQVMDEADAKLAREQVLHELDESCAAFVERVGARLRHSPATAFTIPTTLE